MSISILFQTIVFCWSVSLCACAVKFGSFPGVDYIFSHTNGDQWCNPSFECDIMSYLCQEINDQEPCSMTILQSLEERLTALEQDQVDIVVSRFSVSPKRQQRVDFIRPYYFTTGAQLFTLPEDKNKFSGFESLTSLSVCMDVGFYAAQTLAEQFGMIVFPATKGGMFELIQNGLCVAAITDSTFTIEGLMQANVKPIYAVPYGVAISKTPTIPNLAQVVQEALLKMQLIRDDGSTILDDLQIKHLLTNSVEPPPELVLLSEAITANNGRYIGEDLEDEFWQAANLSTRKYKNELQVIDPFYEQNCREALTNIHNAFANGAEEEDLPIIRIDDFSYTTIIDMTTYLKDNQTVTILGNPIFQDDTNIFKFDAENPWSLQRLQILGSAFLNNQEDGKFYYTTVPIEKTFFSPNFNDSTAEGFSMLTIRMVTYLHQAIIGQGIYKGRVFQAGCQVGETRDW